MTEQKMPLPADTVETASTKTQGHCITIESICQIAQLCAAVSMFTQTDAFFSYSPHVQQMGVRIYDGGWHSGQDTTKDFTIYDDSLIALRRAKLALLGYLLGEVIDFVG